MDGRLMRRAPKRRTEKRGGSTEVVGRGLDFERWRGRSASEMENEGVHGDTKSIFKGREVQ